MRRGPWTVRFVASSQTTLPKGWPWEIHWVGSSLYGSGRPLGYWSAATCRQYATSKGVFSKYPFSTLTFWLIRRTLWENWVLEQNAQIATVRS